MATGLRVAVVGRSACTSDAARVAELVGAELCRAGHTVLGYFGFGVAAAALRGAADQAACGYGPAPVAFVGHRDGRVLVPGLLREMDEQLGRWRGAGQMNWHYTEPGYRPPMFRSVLAAHCDAMVVIDGLWRGGPAIEAAHAANLGRAVFVPDGMPGDVADHAVPARLLAHGAALPFRDIEGLCAALAALPAVVGEGA